MTVVKDGDHWRCDVCGTHLLDEGGEPAHDCPAVQAQWAVDITQGEYEELRDIKFRVLPNEKARADAAEKQIEKLTTELGIKAVEAKNAWQLRDYAIEERQEAEAALRSALRLSAYLIKDVLRGMPE